MRCQTSYGISHRMQIFGVISLPPTPSHPSARSIPRAIIKRSQCGRRFPSSPARIAGVVSPLEICHICQRQMSIPPLQIYHICQRQMSTPHLHLWRWGWPTGRGRGLPLAIIPRQHCGRPSFPLSKYTTFASGRCLLPISNYITSASGRCLLPISIYGEGVADRPGGEVPTRHHPLRYPCFGKHR